MKNLDNLTDQLLALFSLFLIAIPIIIMVGAFIYGGYEEIDSKRCALSAYQSCIQVNGQNCSEQADVVCRGKKK